jgi:hypothetical protein
VRVEVAFDLVVEATRAGVDPSATGDVAGGQHLLVKVVEAAALGDDRHSLVVRHERAAQVDAIRPWCTTMKSTAFPGDSTRNTAVRQATTGRI